MTLELTPFPNRVYSSCKNQFAHTWASPPFFCRDFWYNNHVPISNVVELSDFQMQVCIGTLLGDTSASRPENGKNFHLSCYHSKKQIEWLKMKWEWLSPFSRPIQYCAYLDKRDNKIRSGARFHTISAPCFTRLAELFYHVGQKIIPKSISKLMLHPVALACLICDDGSWDRAGISIASKQFTIHENEKLAEALEKSYGLNIGIMRNGKYPHLRITAQSVSRAKDICHDYVPDFLIYKFGGGNYQTRLVGKKSFICPICRKKFVTYASNHQIYCSRACASIGKPKGYITRKEKRRCAECGNEFIPYIKKQIRCKNCVTP